MLNKRIGNATTTSEIGAWDVSKYGAAIPGDLLPFYFAIEPAPTDSRTAFAIAQPVSHRSDVGVSVILEDPSQCREIFRFSRLGFVNIAWSPSGRFLAFAHASTLMLRNPGDTLELSSLSEHVEWLGFDRNEQLWCLAGGCLQVRLASDVRTVSDQVDSVAVADFVAYCRREESGICVYLHDGKSERRLACLCESIDDVSVELSFRGNYLVVVLGSRSVRDRARVRILRFDVEASEMEMLMDEYVAFGFNGGPAISAAALTTGEVLAAYESGKCCQVWSLAPGTGPRPVSPPSFEVFDFVVDASGARVAIIASDTETVLGSSQRHLLVAEREGDEWRVFAPVRGVFQMPRWRQDGRLEVVCGENGRWTRRVGCPAEIRSVEDSGWCCGEHVSKDAAEYDSVRLPGPQYRQAGIILLPRLHQQFVAGAQSFFFHHLLFCLARRLAEQGYHVVMINGPGAIGRGRSRREPPGSYFLALRSATDDLVQALKSEGCRVIGILAGSLAAVPALRMVGPGTQFSACAFIAPLFEASIPVTMPVRHHLLDDPAIEPLEAAAVKVEVPLLVIHGGRDELVPLSQLKELCNRVRNPSLVQLCVFEEEDHIFKQAHSWLCAQSATEDFFSSHLR